MPEITEDAVMRVVERIEAGTLRVSKDAPWVAWSNLVTFTTADGWEFTVFSDVGQWDYIDSIRSPDGAVLGSPVIDQLPKVDDYQPKTIHAARCWGLSHEEAQVLVSHATS